MKKQTEERITPPPIYTDIIACDLSMRRPGFAVLRYYTRGNVVKV